MSNPLLKFVKFNGNNLCMKKSVINDDYSKIYLCYIPSNRNGHCFYNNIYDNSFSSIIDFENIV